MNRFKKPKRDRSIFPTESDIKILSVIVSQEKGVSWGTIKQETGLSEKTVSKRLKILAKEGIIKRRVESDTFPPTPIYAINGSNPPTESDVGLVNEAMRYITYINKLHKFTDRVARSTTGQPNLLEIYYFRLFPYFLLCLYYGSKTETLHAEKLITKLYLDELREKIGGTIQASERQQSLKELIAFTWNNLAENELKKEAAAAERVFVSSFPPDLQDLAFGFFHYYLNKRIESDMDVTSEFEQFLDPKSVRRREFENYIGKKVPRYRLERFWNALKR